MSPKSFGTTLLPSFILVLLFITVTLQWLHLYNIRPPLLLGSARARPAPDNTERRDEIVSAFRFAWDGYYKLAFPHDELRPLSKLPGYSRNDWGATAIDALGTAILMRETDIVEIIVGHANNVDFTKTKDVISVFETTIRYLGGLLSAYELLKGPFADEVTSNMDVEGLLKQAQVLGDILAHAYKPGQVLPSGILSNDTYEGDDSVGLASAGTMILEWTKLSDLTGHAAYAGLAEETENILVHPKFTISQSFPGMLGTELNMTTNLVPPSAIHWGGGSDSYYEYLIKMYVYDSQAFHEYGESWKLAADSTIQHFGSSPKGLEDMIFLGRYDEKLKRFIPESGHMECFAGGNFILGGTVLGNATYTEFGLRIVEGCRYSYTSTHTRIGPERWMWIPSECDSGESSWQCEQPPDEAKDFHERTSIWMTEPSWNVRPEVIESYYHAWRVTKDVKYRDWAWQAWLAINATARIENGFTYVSNVDAVGSEKQIGDNQESYFFSETLKYLYLIFSDDAEWQVDGGGRNEWVYNTEGHPLRVRRIIPRI